MNICLCEMTKELARKFFAGFVPDPALFIDQSNYRPYVYTQNDTDERVERYCRLGRIHLAVMMDEEPIGEVVLKNIDYDHNECTIGISLKSDEFKNKGYGTMAEIQTLHYAFHELGMATVFADALVTNVRSRHVLEKVGFKEMHRDKEFVYYRCDNADWKLMEQI